MEAARKRGRTDAGSNGNGAAADSKKPREIKSAVDLLEPSMLNLSMCIDASQDAPRSQDVSRLLLYAPRLPKNSTDFDNTILEGGINVRSAPLVVDANVQSSTNFASSPATIIYLEMHSQNKQNVTEERAAIIIQTAFRTAGCPFGEGCHFMHYVPGGFNAVAQMMNLGNTAPVPSRNPMAQSRIPDGPPASAVKTKMCNKYNTAEGCKFGDMCHFAHGERELGRPAHLSHNSAVAPHLTGRSGHLDRPQQSSLAAAAGFGTSTIATISVVASLAGVIIGKRGANTKEICHLTGVKLSIRDHDSDTNLRNIVLEGTFDQVGQASAMVKELILKLGASHPLPASNYTVAAAPGKGNNYKTKVCENFAKGTCTFGDRCHFAHGSSELRTAA